MNKLFRLFCWLFFSALFLYGASPEPTPSHRVEAKDQQEKVKEKDKNVRQQDAITKPLTLPVVSDLVRTPQTNRETPKPQQDSNPPTPNEHKSWWSDPTTLFTGILALVAFVQFWVLFYQVINTRNERRISERAWVMVSFNQPFSAGNDRNIKFKMINTGKTRGYTQVS